MTDTITISGTDPNNPKSAQHIVDRLKQIERDVFAMRDEARRLAVQSGAVMEVMRDQGYSTAQARDAAQEIAERIRRLSRQLEDAAAGAGVAEGAVHQSGVRLKTRFEWRPARVR